MDEHEIDELGVITPEQHRQLREAGFSKRARAAAATQMQMFQVERPVAPTSRAKPAERPVSFPRATAGHVVWRDVPSRFQVREPSRDLATLKATKSPPWVRKRKARAKTKLAKASRVANRG